MYTIISGTNRLKSNSNIVGEKYLELLSERIGIENALHYDLQQIPQNFSFAELYGNRTNEFQEVIEKFITPAEKFIFIVPEYNGSFPGVLKLFIDAVHPDSFKNKKAALVGVSSGRAGNIRGLDHFTGVLNYIGVSVLASKAKLSGIENLIQEGKLLDADAMKALNEQIELLVQF